MHLVYALYTADYTALMNPPPFPYCSPETGPNGLRPDITCTLIDTPYHLSISAPFDVPATAVASISVILPAHNITPTPDYLPLYHICIEINAICS